MLRPIARRARDFKSVLLPAEVHERALRLFQKLRERSALWEQRQCAQHLSCRLKFLVGAPEAVRTQNFKIIHQQLAVTFSQNAFECAAAKSWRQNRRVGQRVKKAKKRTEARRALQFNPCLPFRRFENTGNHVRKPVIVRYAEACQRGSNQTRQRAATGKNHADQRASFFRQISNTLPRDCLGLLRDVRSDKKIEAFRGLRASAHFSFTKKRITKRPGGLQRALRFTANLFP